MDAGTRTDTPPGECVGGLDEVVVLVGGGGDVLLIDDPPPMLWEKTFSIRKEFLRNAGLVAYQKMMYCEYYALASPPGGRTARDLGGRVWFYDFKLMEDFNDKSTH